MVVSRMDDSPESRAKRERLAEKIAGVAIGELSGKGIEVLQQENRKFKQFTTKEFGNMMMKITYNMFPPDDVIEIPGQEPEYPTVSPSHYNSIRARLHAIPFLEQVMPDVWEINRDKYENVLKEVRERG